MHPFAYRCLPPDDYQHGPEILDFRPAVAAGGAAFWVSSWFFEKQWNFLHVLFGVIAFGATVNRFVIPERDQEIRKNDAARATWASKYLCLSCFAEWTPE
jgi:hypothetical protein